MPAPSHPRSVIAMPDSVIFIPKPRHRYSSAGEYPEKGSFRYFCATSLISNRVFLLA